ncbi:hypothetical protein AAIB46_26855 [Streptomyces sp. 35M1]|uniref:hypothetical protein n=1 Tax=Streptomyces sp. 35M1 TaxID=3142978 RepID=UPI0039906121
MRTDTGTRLRRRTRTTDGYEHLATRSQAEGIPPLPLVGEPVNAVGDAGPAPAVAGLGVALHEEATPDLLADDLGIP